MKRDNSEEGGGWVNKLLCVSLLLLHLEGEPNGLVTCTIDISDLISMPAQSGVKHIVN